MKTWVTPHLVQSLSEVIDSAIELTSADFSNIQLLDAGSRLKIVAQRHFPAMPLGASAIGVVSRVPPDVFR
ncbi:hypothetical protein JZU56_02375 [bacterium]|nr:hypothetical protein [bacterium]